MYAWGFKLQFFNIFQEGSIYSILIFYEHLNNSPTLAILNMTNYHIFIYLIPLLSKYREE